MRRTLAVRLSQLRDAVRPSWMKFFLLIASVLITGFCSGYRINVSRSLALGLYRVIGDSTVVERGSIVIVCLPEAWSRFAVRRQILGPGQCTGGSYGLGKFVIAIEGDVVTLSRDRLTVNGEFLANSHTLERDRLGRAMPHFPWGTVALHAGEVWLYACHPSAFDSRYVGPVRTSSIKSVIAPVLTRPAGSSPRCLNNISAEHSRRLS